MMVLLSLLLSKFTEIADRTWKTAADAFDQMAPPLRGDRDPDPPTPAWFKYPPIS
jgi:hypothetical protein